VDLKDHSVNFRVCDIFYPDYEQVLFSLHGNDVLQGRVIGLSASGEDVSFAEIEVDELEQRVIVPVDRILDICE
jgi:predicted ester cyclase